MRASARARVLSRRPGGSRSPGASTSFFVLACFAVWSVSFGRLSVGLFVCVLSVAGLCCLPCSTAPEHFLLAHQPHAVAAQVTPCSVSSGLGGGLSKNDIPQVCSEPLCFLTCGGPVSYLDLRQQAGWPPEGTMEANAPPLKF